LLSFVCEGPRRLLAFAFAFVCFLHPFTQPRPSTSTSSSCSQQKKYRRLPDLALTRLREAQGQLKLLATSYGQFSAQDQEEFIVMAQAELDALRTTLEDLRGVRCHCCAICRMEACSWVVRSLLGKSLILPTPAVSCIAGASAEAVAHAKEDHRRPQRRYSADGRSGIPGWVRQKASFGKKRKE
jgi:hypothetical protein